MNNLKFEIQTSNKGTLRIPMSPGQIIFVLGANGVGKSTLMQNLYTQNKKFAKRILAHRRTWFSSNAMNLTAQSKKQVEEQMVHSDSNIQSRWMDSYSEQRSSISIFDLINSENIRAREIARDVDGGNIDSAKHKSKVQAPIQAINELLAISNIPIAISLEKGEQLFATKNGCTPYSIAELSDGERNALLIATDVLTSDSNSLIIIDEPERHLHRSIISPLLSTLFAKRKDCVFIISTHDTLLPLDNDTSKILLLRSCQWNGNNIQSWDADLIENNNKIPDNVKQEILGSKRKILFVEGDSKSLDKQIYQLIFPTVTVQALGDCGQVEKAVDGIIQTEELHWLDAYGLIDADDRTPEQINKLKEKGIIALPCYSIESLYYSIEVICHVAKRYSEIIETSEEELYNKAISKILHSIIEHKERLCARRSERKVRNRVMNSLPKYQDIQGKHPFEISFNLGDYLTQEMDIFDSFVNSNNLNGLIERYPIRETPVIKEISGAFGLDRKTYEGVVRKLIIDNPATLHYFKSKLNALTAIIETTENAKNQSAENQNSREPSMA